MTSLGNLRLHAFVKLPQHHTQHPIVNHHVPRFFIAILGYAPAFAVQGDAL